MSTKKVWDLSPEEFKELIRPSAGRILKDKWQKNGYITYYDEEYCDGPDILIHEFKDRKELVRINDEGNAEFIRRLS